MSRPLLLSYDGCGTCKNARKWLAARESEVEVRPIVTSPPTREELAAWIPASGLSVRKWLNTSGQSYRALGKEAVAAMSDEALLLALSRDGKLVKRPVLVDGGRVVVGFREEAYAAHFGSK
jgi:arsenate reductase